MIFLLIALIVFTIIAVIFDMRQRKARAAKAHESKRK